MIVAGAVMAAVGSSVAAQPQDPSFAGATLPPIVIPDFAFLIATGDATSADDQLPIQEPDGKPEVAILGQLCADPEGGIDCDTVIQVSRNTTGQYGATLSFGGWQTLLVDAGLAMTALGDSITVDGTETVAQMDFIDVTNDGAADIVLLAELLQGPGSAIIVYAYNPQSDGFDLITTVATTSSVLSAIVYDDWNNDGVLDIVAATDTFAPLPRNTLWRFTNTFNNGSFGHFVTSPGVIQTSTTTGNPTKLAVATDLRRFSTISQQGTAADGLDVVTLDNAGPTSLTRADAVGNFQFSFSDFGASGFPASGEQMFAANLKSGTQDKSILIWNGAKDLDALHTLYRSGLVLGSNTYTITPTCPQGQSLQQGIIDRAAIGHLNGDDQHDVAIVNNACDEVHLLIGDGANRTMTGTNSLGVPIVLPLLVNFGGSFNEVVIDDMDGDGSDDILVLRADSRFSVFAVEYLENLN